MHKYSYNRFRVFFNTSTRCTAAHLQQQAQPSIYTYNCFHQPAYSRRTTPWYLGADYNIQMSVVLTLANSHTVTQFYSPFFLYSYSILHFLYFKTVILYLFFTLQVLLLIYRATGHLRQVGKLQNFLFKPGAEPPPSTRARIIACDILLILLNGSFNGGSMFGPEQFTRLQFYVRSLVDADNILQHLNYTTVTQFAWIFISAAMDARHSFVI